MARAGRTPLTAKISLRLLTVTVKDDLILHDGDVVGTQDHGLSLDGQRSANRQARWTGSHPGSRSIPTIDGECCT